MYYRPTPNNHIGFIAEVKEAANGRFEIRSVDGNSGPSFSTMFDMSHGRKIGYGFIYSPPGFRRLADECYYIKLCDSDF